MAHKLPTTMKQWVLQNKSGFGNLLYEEFSLPEIGDFDVQIKVYAVSLNYRDLIIAEGTYYWPLDPNVVPTCVPVLATGAYLDLCFCSRTVHRRSTYYRTTRHSFLPRLSRRRSSPPNTVSWHPHRLRCHNSLSGLLDGVLHQYAAYHEGGLVELPASLSWREGATLACAALTAWNSLYGGTQALRPGEMVLVQVQGTGGVSLSGCQFAKASGAQVIATTSGEKMGC
ncbi:Zinc-type alcohol dehydrogenase-like protein [Lachnellula occidentalis]|uniref:Zinc-type alcohol dehydrogenase-like protein n=1 Tax=Lachnellula occidentalis TaxID=215460 RepID=A0A8H8RNJ4_9HELO|nr:Zinc-type alcohol dehydrogenase-like protein [Lachnellula occidentalis]